MPDLPNRDEWERKLARLMGRFFSGRLRDLLDELGDPPNLNNLSQAWYDSLNEVQVPLQDVLQTIYLESAEGLLNSQPIGVDWGLVNERAARWAKEYGFDLVRGINDTTRGTLREVIPAAFEEGLTLRELKNRLSGSFGPVRAEMIAVTEVTRASVRGELAFADELRKEGVQMVAVWQTNNDDLVCPICGPLNNKKRGDGWETPPPAHPRCRCWLTHEAQVTGEEAEGELPQTFSPSPQQNFKDFGGNVPDMAEYQQSDAVKQWEAGLTDREQRTVDFYQGPGHEKLNEFLRAGGTSPYELQQQQFERYAADLDSALAKSALDEGLTVHRGISREAVRSIFGGDDIPTGVVISDQAYLSTSLSEAVARDFAGDGVVMELRVPEGTHAASVGNLREGFEHEREILLARDQRIMITNSYVDPDGIQRIVGEIVPSAGR